MDKREQGHRPRGLPVFPSERAGMRFVGIDIGAERHLVAWVDEQGTILQRPTAFREDRESYQQLLSQLGSTAETLIVMEATGHYWQNLFATLAAEGFAIALINPLRTRRFAEEDLVRTKTDAIDALGLARFGQQKRPLATELPDVATRDLRELVRLRVRFLQDFGDRTRQLHRAVDLSFPEFTRFVVELDSSRATALLHAFPTAAAVHAASARQLAAVRGGQRTVGRELARALKAAAATSVGQHATQVYSRQVRFFCEDLDLLRRRLGEIERDIEQLLANHQVGRLLTTIDGIGSQTAARLVAELGDPAKFRNAGALTAYVGAIPGLRQSGKQTWDRAGLARCGHAKLRAALWMPTLVAVRRNPWLRAYYERLRARGKLPKVALMAAMRKLLIAIYAVAKHRRPFVPVITMTAP
jgi:transposase